MSDNKKNKKYSKIKESKKTVILAKRQTNPKCEQVQPKILLKSNKEKDQQQPALVTVASRDRESQSQEASSSQSPNNMNIQIKEREYSQTSAIQTEQPIVIPVPIMTKPILLVSTANYQVNSNAIKMLLKSNTDFFVVGVLGTHGVGKSTIMNLLAVENFESFVNTTSANDGEIFSVKLKSGKCLSSPRTESINMFVTKDRIILLDCPPVLSNVYKKDAMTNELDDIRLIITLLTVCHLIIVVQDEYLNLNLLRLLQFAELTKPNQDSKPSSSSSTSTSTFYNDYMPNILFVKNKANRLDFLTEEKLKMESLLLHFFKKSLLNIYIENNYKHKEKRKVNYLLIPDFKDDFSTSTYLPHMETIFNEFRNHVFMTPRNPFYNANIELTEFLWFDLLSSTMSNKNHFFLTSYEEIKKSQRDTDDH